MGRRCHVEGGSQCHSTPRRLTLPSRGRPQSGFACLRAPLMSNVRRQEADLPMSNFSIIERMQGLVDSYQAKSLTATQVEGALETSMEALERIQTRHIHEMRHLTYRLVTSDFSVGEEVFYSAESVDVVIKDLRAFISGLPS